MTPKEQQDQRNFVHTVNVLLTSALAERELGRPSPRSPSIQTARRPYLSLLAAASMAIAALAIALGGYQFIRVPTMGIGGQREAKTAATELAKVDAKSRKEGSNEHAHAQADVTAKARADAEAKRLADAAAAKERAREHAAPIESAAAARQRVEGARRKEEERRQIAAREEPPSPAALPSPAGPTQ